MAKLSVGFDEAQQMTGISHFTLRKMVSNGKIKVSRVGRRVLIPISEIERLAKPGANIRTS